MRRLYEPLLPLHELIEMLRERQSRFWDKVVPAENLRIDDQTANLVVRNGSTSEHEWQPQAFSLLCSKLRVPASYATRCSAWLQADNFNTWLRANPSRRFLLRFDGDQVRSVLSPKYMPVSNLELAETLQRQAGNVIVRAEVDNLRMLLQLVTSRGEEVSYGERIHGGLHVANSEVGHRVVELRAMLYRVICTNGLIMGGADLSYRRRHLGDADEVLRQFRRRAAQAIEAGSSLPGRLADIAP